MQLGSRSRQQLIAPECSKQGAALRQISCGEQTNIKFVLICVLQSAQRINSEHAHPQTHASSFPELINGALVYNACIYCMYILQMQFFCPSCDRFFEYITFSKHKYIDQSNLSSLIYSESRVIQHIFNIFIIATINVMRRE